MHHPSSFQGTPTLEPRTFFEDICASLISALSFEGTILFSVGSKDSWTIDFGEGTIRSERPDEAPDLSVRMTRPAFQAYLSRDFDPGGAMDRGEITLSGNLELLRGLQMLLSIQGAKS